MTLVSLFWVSYQNTSQINKLSRESVESDLIFAGFLVFHCPLKADAVQTLKMLADSSHRVSGLFTVLSVVLTCFC